MRIVLLVPSLLTVGCSASTVPANASWFARAQESDPRGPDVVAVAPLTTGEVRKPLAYVVASTLGDSELVADDAITIDQIRGTAPTFELGETYRIAGHYRLASIEHASLLASVAVTAASGHRTTPPATTLDVARGTGSFVFDLTLADYGYPHVSFYGPDGNAFGGVYFGTDEWVLSNKGWSYAQPGPAPAPPRTPVEVPFELLFTPTSTRDDASGPLSRPSWRTSSDPGPWGSSSGPSRAT